MTRYNALLDAINKNKTFLLTTHVNPDADAIGSEMALYYTLQRLGKEVKIVNFSETPDFLKFLDPPNVVEKFDPELHSDFFLKCDVVVALDFNRCDRTVKMSPLFYQREGIKMCIDHHLEPEPIFNPIFDDPSFAATSHIIYDFIMKTGITEMDYEMAVPLYAGISTDTGSFKYDRTTPELHRIAAHLLELGVVPIEINDLIFGQDNLSKFALLGRALNSLQLYGDDDRFAVMTLTQHDFIESKATEPDTEGFINLCMTIKNVKISAIFIGLKEGFKVSLRSKGTISVRDMAAQFGGGGHRNASGIRIREFTLEEKQDEIINYILESTKEVSQYV
ncbi:bifunctional oligoribonuclease/PAP phosphatase NrnA [Ignavibacteriales bacterium]